MMQAPPSAIAQQWALGARANQLAMNNSGTQLAVALGDGRIVRLKADAGAQQPDACAAHGTGVSLEMAACGADDFVSGGDDGRVLRLLAGEREPQLLAEQKGRWIDHVAAAPDGKLLAYSYGKNLQIMAADGAPHGIARPHPSSIGGLAFSPNGKRLAASHNNGVSLWWTAATAQSPVVLNWKGSHLLVNWQPDGKILMTTMQENALHGWRLADMNEMRMQGYAGKINNMAWSPKARYLVTSGAPQAICWPYFGGGPWGKAPQALGLDRGVLVRYAQPHPRDELIAIGYADGAIELAPLDGRPGVMIHPPVDETGHAVTGLGWNAPGDCLFAATESGYVMLFTLDSVAQAVTR